MIRARLAVAAVLLCLPRAAEAQTAAQALAECRTLWERDQLPQAIPRCEEAAALDFGLGEAHFLLGRAHYLLAARNDGGEAEREAHRRKGMESYRRYLAMAESAGEHPANRPRALGELLGLYILGPETDEAIVPYADELARLHSPQFEHLVYLSATYERHQRFADSERTIRLALEANPTHTETCLALAATLGRPVWGGAPRFDEMIATLERCAGLTPRDPIGYFRLASMLWDKAYRDVALPADRKAAYVMRGLAHADNALAIDPDYFEAVIYKGLLLRLRARDEADPAEQARLLEDAVALQKKGLALKAAGKTLRQDPYASFFVPVQPPPPPPPPAPMPALGGVTGGVPPAAVGGGTTGRIPAAPSEQQPVRVGGAIREPKKLKNVDPVYPSIAQQARVQGVVILEVTIGTDGRVTDARILRSIPLLDQAALDAVRQWVYTPTLLNGIPVPVIMTVTANFRLT